MEFKSVGIAEADFRKWCSSARIVDDVLHHAADVAMSFREVEGSESGRSLVEASMGRWAFGYSLFGQRRFNGGYGLTEDRPTTLPLIADHSTHGDLLLT